MSRARHFSAAVAAIASYFSAVKPQLVQMNFVRASEMFARVGFREGAQPLVTTQAFDWPGLRLEAGMNNIAAVDEVAGLHHYVSMNLDERPVTLEVKGDRGEFERVVLRRGMAWVCPAHELVSVRLNSSFHYVRVSIDPLYFDRLTTQPGRPPVELRRTCAIGNSQISHILGALTAESDAGNPGGIAFVEALATGLSQQLALHAGVSKPFVEQARGGLSSTAKRVTLELMNEQLDGRLTIEVLARETGLSAAHFARAFKETMGLAPHRYLLNLRLERARRMLDAPEAILSDVALRTGFADQAHFSRLFKREFGITPGTVVRSKRRGLSLAE
jgi:AraC family transcriptional regulator